MRYVFTLLGFLAAFGCYGASAYWSGVGVWTDMSAERNEYHLYGDIHAANGAKGSILARLFGHEEDGDFYLNAFDYDFPGSMVEVNTVMVLAMLGDVLGDDTFESAIRIVLCDDGDTVTGGTRIEGRSNFYLGFMTSETGVENGQRWYGWAQLSVDEDRVMTVLASGIGLNGEPVTVGETIPEPSGALLLLLGLGVLGLRRRVV